MKEGEKLEEGEENAGIAIKKMPPSETRALVAEEERSVQSVQVIAVAFEDEVDFGAPITACSVSSSDTESVIGQYEKAKQHPTTVAADENAWSLNAPPKAQETGSRKGHPKALRQTSSDEASDEVLVVESGPEPKVSTEVGESVIDISHIADPWDSLFESYLDPSDHRRASLVQSIRDKFEKGTSDSFDVDLEKFYMEQKAQLAEYQRKKKEALVLYRGAEDAQGGIDQSHMSRGRKSHEGDYLGRVFVVHEEHGLLIKKSLSAQPSTTEYQVPECVIRDSDLAAMDHNCGDARIKLLCAARVGAARELFETTGIDTRGNLDRLVPANLRSESLKTLMATSAWQYDFKRQLNFFLFLSGSDAHDGIASAFSDGSKSHSRYRHSGFAFEKDPVVAFEMLADKSGCFDVADALILSMEENHPMFSEMVGGLQYRSMAKLVSDNKATTRTNGHQTAQADFKESMPDAISTLRYIRDIWAHQPDNHPEDISLLLKFLSAQHCPNFSVAEVIQIQRELDVVRTWQRKYDGLHPSSQQYQIHQPDEDLLRQLFTMKAVLCENRALYESICCLVQLNAEIKWKKIKLVESSGDDNEIKDVMSDLDSALSEPDSHIDSLNPSAQPSSGRIGQSRFHCKSKMSPTCLEADPTETQPCGESTYSSCSDKSFEGRRSIPGGDVYPANRWEQLSTNPLSRLKNKIVLSTDLDEVEVVAVVLMSQRPDVFASSLCVLNNEKPSALRGNRNAGPVKKSACQISSEKRIQHRRGFTI